MSRAGGQHGSYSILTDVTKCVGCEKCVIACEKTWNTGNTIPSVHAAPDGLSGTRWTSIVKIGDRFVRKQCLHCEDPACVSACPVHAFEKLPEGPVIYDASKCIGCRYCMISCPFKIPRYEWNSPVPFIQKCKFCIERLRDNKIPACVGACPYGATIFGAREELLAKAKHRIASAPGNYINRVYGETDYGGTSVMYISDVPLEELGFPAKGSKAINAGFSSFTSPATALTPFLGGSVLLATSSVGWIINRRIRIAEETRRAEAERAVREMNDERG